MKPRNILSKQEQASFVNLRVLNPSSHLQCKLPTPVIHFKGFGRYINYEGTIVQKLQPKCVQTLCNLLQNGGTLVWDGDSYKSDSFTCMIPLAFDELFSLTNLPKNTQKHPITNKVKQWSFFAFIKQKDTKRFTNSWSHMLRLSQYNSELSIQFALKPLTQISNFIDLGVEALKITKARTVLCFGGGYVVNHEYNTLMEQRNNKNIVMFYVYGVGRYNKSQQKFEFASLMHFDKYTRKFTIQDRFKKWNNIGYFDADSNQWSVNCIDPMTHCMKTITVPNCEEKKENKSNESNNINIQYNAVRTEDIARRNNIPSAHVYHTVSWAKYMNAQWNNASKMHKNILEHKKDAFTLNNVLSVKECKILIYLSECHGYAPLLSALRGGKGRTNTRMITEDQLLANLLYERIKARLPKTYKIYGETWEMCGLNERFRFCKYTPGQQFNVHNDKRVELPKQNRASFYTVNIYLNDGMSEYGGGRTVFYKSGNSFKHRQWNQSSFVIGQPGLALIFNHFPKKYKHSGERVTSGVKYIFRSDVMYRLKKCPMQKSYPNRW